MAFLSETFNEHVVYVDLNRLPYHMPEYFNDHPLISCPYILQSKRHHLVAICPPWCDESCLFLVGKIYWDLMVALKNIQETQPRMSGSRVTSRSIRGRGKGSFGQALFKSVKSIQTLHFPFFFFTTTVFESQIGYCTSRIALNAKRRSTPSRIIRALSGASFRRF